MRYNTAGGMSVRCYAMRDGKELAKVFKEEQHEDREAKEVSAWMDNDKRQNRCEKFV